GQTVSLETLCANRAGNLLPVNLSAAPVRDDRQELCGAIAVLEDITERKRIETDLSESSAVLSAVTHSLNTLLDTGDWTAASQHLLSFALFQTGSDFGFLGVVLDQNTLCVLAPDGTTWNVSLESVPAESANSRRTQSPSSVHFDYLLAQVIAGRRTVIADS